MQHNSLAIRILFAVLLAGSVRLAFAETDPAAPRVFKTTDGKCEFSVDASQSPELKQWAEGELATVMADWYPKITEMLPSDGFTAPVRFTLKFQKPRKGVAETSENRITCNADWMRKNQKGESKGAIVHEMVHVIQQYGRVRHASRNPAWLVEGIADYIRWYKYEPQSHGTEIHDVSRVRYDDSYRVTAHFLNWATEKYDKSLVAELNAAMRQGKYSDDLWKKYTGKTADELGAEWKKSLAGD